MSYTRPGPSITVATVAADGSLPDVVDGDSGVELAPLTVGIASPSTGDTARALPTSATLYFRAGDGETVTLVGPIKAKGYRAPAWYNLGYLFGGVTGPEVSDLNGEPATIRIPPGCTRIAVVSEGAGPHVAGGTLDIALEASITVPVGDIP